jgi:hypothetical protein
VANVKYKLSQSLPGITEKTHNKLSQAIRCLCKDFLAYINIILKCPFPKVFFKYTTFQKLILLPSTCEWLSF